MVPLALQLVEPGDLKQAVQPQGHVGKAPERAINRHGIASDYAVHALDQAQGAGHSQLVVFEGQPTLPSLLGIGKLIEAECRPVVLERAHIANDAPRRQGQALNIRVVLQHVLGHGLKPLPHIADVAHVGGQGVGRRERMAQVGLNDSGVVGRQGAGEQSLLANQGVSLLAHPGDGQRAAGNQGHQCHNPTEGFGVALFKGAKIHG